MSRQRITSFVRSMRTVAMSVLVVAGVTLTACGPLGDDDSDPTATSETIEQPTTSATEESTATESGGTTDSATEPVEPGTPVEDGATPSSPLPFDRGTPVSEETEATTEVVSVSTPVLDLEGDGSESGTPVTDESESLATPSDTEGTGESTEAATEEAAGDETSSPSGFGGSDGTSGATPHSESTEAPSDPGSDEATPFFVRDDPTPTPTPDAPEASPVGDGTPVAPGDATISDISPVIVTSCEPEDVPEITLEQVVYLTTDDVNFRTGPGADCDLISTIGINQEATLLGGPVTREEDDFVWAQVQIAGETGWVVIDVLEPAG